MGVLKGQEQERIDIAFHVKGLTSQLIKDLQTSEGWTDGHTHKGEGVCPKATRSLCCMIVKTRISLPQRQQKRSCSWGLPFTPYPSCPLPIQAGGCLQLLPLPFCCFPGTCQGADLPQTSLGAALGGKVTHHSISLRDPSPAPSFLPLPQSPRCPMWPNLKRVCRPCPQVTLHGDQLDQRLQAQSVGGQLWLVHRSRPSEQVQLLQPSSWRLPGTQLCPWASVHSQ